MVDPGEQVSLTLQREFSEEALNSLAVPPSERAEIHKRITELFKSAGFEVKNRHPLACLVSCLNQQLFLWGKLQYVFFSFRFIKATWMILETLTMLGWRQSLLTSMMTQVSIINNSKTFFPFALSLLKILLYRSRILFMRQLLQQFANHFKRLVSLQTINSVFVGHWHICTVIAGNSVSELPLQAGDDAGQVQWVDVDSSFPLYASHSHFLELVAKERKAHWWPRTDLNRLT